MNKYRKEYIGKAKKKTDNYNNNVFECCIDLDKAALHGVYGKSGKQNIYFNVAPMREVDAWGNTHTIYVNVKNEAGE